MFRYWKMHDIKLFMKSIKFVALTIVDAAYSTMSESTVSLFKTSEIFDARSDLNVMTNIRGGS